MAKEYLSHDELQHIEHANKILNDHIELLATVKSIGEETFTDVIKSYRAYLAEFRDIQTQMGIVIKRIIESTRETRLATSNTQDILSYCSAIDKLNALLDDKLIEKLRRVSGQSEP